MPEAGCMRVLLAACLGLFFAWTGGARAAQTVSTAAQRKPFNILWLSYEDSSPWLACYGDKTAPTPNIDRLAREGIRYTNVFATAPVCAPARHAIITGMHAVSTGAMHMRNGQRSAAPNLDPRAYDDIPLYEAVPPAQVRCFPEFLRADGWYASNNYKQDYQFVAPPTAWDESSRDAHWRKRAPGQRFFSVFNCHHTHESRAFPDAPLRPEVVKPADVNVPPYYPDTPAVRQTLARTYNNIVAMDQWVGERLAELEQDGLLDSTIIFFFSDHGAGLPRAKRLLYDSGLRAPLIVRFPDGRRAGASDDRLISFIDFAPTMLSLAGIRPKPYMRGSAFLGDFAGEPPRFVFAASDRMDSEKDTIRAVSDGRLKYIRNLRPDVPYINQILYRERLPMMKDIRALASGGDAKPQQWQMVARTKPAEEFYDTASDPHELRNLIDDPSRQDDIATMRAALDRWTKETGDLGLIQPETKLVKEKLWPPDGVQPTTAAPTAQITGGRLSAACTTDGASIGYRRQGDGAWLVWTQPVPIQPGQTYELIAHRIGYKPSEVATVSSQESP